MTGAVGRTQSESAAYVEPLPRKLVSTGESSAVSQPFDDTVIPSSHQYRTIVLCFDGTGDQFDADNSNIVQLFSMLKKDDRSQQMVYYQAGIGTYTVPQIATPFMASLDKTIDMAIGNHLDAHVMSGYEFLMQNYQAEDKICLFGFSRGAYTARSLAGMIHKVGLLPACNHQQVPFAYKMYTREDEIGWKQSTAFKKAFSVDVEIEFLGVWDTVSSVGLNERRLPFTASNTAIRFFRHAISLDERRAKFKAKHFQPSPPHVCDLGVQPGEMPRSNQTRHPHSHHQDHRHTSAKHLEEHYDDGPRQSDSLEVWFAGCHCDVGGGSVPNGTRNSLARISLRWMIRQIFLAGTGIQFHRNTFADIGMDPTSLYPIVLPRPPALPATPSLAGKSARTVREQTEGTLVEEPQAAEDAAATMRSEEEEDAADAVSPLYDMLRLKKGWWILEVLPLRQRVKQKENLKWEHDISWNLGRARVIPEQEGHKVYIHRSVKIRMDAEDLKGGKYKPRPELPHKFEWAD
ncbi:hypothetical protein FA95DRAFT_1531273 [Auriscalpium vulgare]|uniref:Uncharacterized protein n=1 Tax=Auriscalpium vulgare TaxID=40419 RepID=A0ACB8SAD9_9AGAM|nr:hypothetical protein FA95DRAFT_1531273 [Auriscalpium vulgare]